MDYLIGMVIFVILVVDSALGDWLRNPIVLMGSVECRQVLLEQVDWIEYKKNNILESLSLNVS